MENEKCVNRTEGTEPGEFVDEEAITLTDGSDKKEFADNGVSAAFLRFDDMEDDAKE